MNGFVHAFFHFFYFAILSFATLTFWKVAIACPTLIGLGFWGILASFATGFTMWSFWSFINQSF